MVTIVLVQRQRLVKFLPAEEKGEIVTKTRLLCLYIGAVFMYFSALLSQQKMKTDLSEFKYLQQNIFRALK